MYTEEVLPSMDGQSMMSGNSGAKQGGEVFYAMKVHDRIEKNEDGKRAA